MRLLRILTEAIMKAVIGLTNHPLGQSARRKTAKAVPSDKRTAAAQKMLLHEPC